MPTITASDCSTHSRNNSASRAALPSVSLTTRVEGGRHRTRHARWYLDASLADLLVDDLWAHSEALGDCRLRQLHLAVIAHVLCIGVLARRRPRRDGVLSPAEAGPHRIAASRRRVKAHAARTGITKPRGRCALLSLQSALSGPLGGGHLRRVLRRRRLRPAVGDAAAVHSPRLHGVLLNPGATAARGRRRRRVTLNQWRARAEGSGSAHGLVLTARSARGDHAQHARLQGVQGNGRARSAPDPRKAGAHRRAPPGGLVQARAASTLALIVDQMRLIYDAA